MNLRTMNHKIFAVYSKLQLVMFSTRDIVKGMIRLNPNHFLFLGTSNDRHLFAKM